MRLKLFCVLSAFIVFPVGLFAGQTFSIPVLHAPDVTFSLSVEADTFYIERPMDAFLTLESAPNERSISHPFNQTHTSGFASIDAFEVSSEVINGKRLTTWRYHLTLDAIGPWRINPFIFTLENEQTKVTRDVLVKGMAFPPPAPLPVVEENEKPQMDAQPEEIAYSWEDAKLFMKEHPWLICTFIFVIALACTWKWWFLPIYRYLKERTLPPEKRAEIEFQRLQAQCLLEKGDVKRYFYELTAVVRRYFERAYALRATRQTSQEFLQQLTTMLSLDEVTVETMRTFLQTSDWVKFAGQDTSRDIAEQATREAHVLIEGDTRERRQRNKERKGVVNG
jgi:hypothetical protein